jgi:hypothetical protein
MLLNQILAGNDRQTIEEKGFLEITVNTVRLEDDVYQFRNVTGFGVGNVKTKGFPLSLMIALAVLGLIGGIIPGLSSFSWLFWLLLIGAVMYNASRPKLYGLSLYLNFGNETIFVTQNMEFLKHVVRTLKEFMENPKPGKVINITIGRDMKGNITFGDVHGI